MRALKIIVPVLILLSLFSCSGGSGSDKNTLRVASDITYAPMEYMNEKKEIVGYDIDLINGIAKQMGVPIKIKSVVWDDIFNSFDQGNYDVIISSVSISEEREKKYDFVPYFSAGNVLIINKTSNYQDVTGVRDITHRPIGVQNNTTGSDLLKRDYPDSQVIPYENIPELFNHLISGDLEAAVVDITVAAYYIKQYENTKTPLWIAAKLNEEEYGILIAKNKPEFKAKIQAGLDAYMATDEGKGLAAKYGLAIEKKE